MIHVKSRHKAGTIGYITAHRPRYFEFFDSLGNTEVPDGTKVTRAESASVIKNCNDLVANMTGDWLWFMGDDHTWSPDLLLTLLDADVEAIVPLTPRRNPPFRPVVYKHAEADEPFTWQELCSRQDEGKIQIGCAGQAGLLLRRSGIEKTARKYGMPLFHYADGWREDVKMTARVAECCGLWAHLGAFMGHMVDSTLGIVPLEDGTWQLVANVNAMLLGAEVVKP